MSAVQSLCQTCLLLSRGEVATRGPARDVVARYLRESFGAADSTTLRTRTDRTGSGKLRIVGFHLEDAAGHSVSMVQSGQACTFVFNYACERGPCRNVAFAFGVQDAVGTFLFRNHTTDAGQDFEQVTGDGQFRCHVPRLPLRAGRYMLGFRASVGDEEADYIAGNAASFDVESGDFYGSGRQSDHAPILVDHDWSLAAATVGAAHA
jgi:hypothetical protein